MKKCSYRGNSLDGASARATYFFENLGDKFLRRTFVQVAKDPVETFYKSRRK